MNDPSLPVTRFEVGTRPGFADPRGISVARRIREHLGIAVAGVRTRDVFHVEAELSPEDAWRVCNEFAGAVVRQGAVGRLEDGPFDVAVAVGFKPGVTDPVGKSARVAIEDLLGRTLGPAAHVYTSRLFLLDGVTRAAAERIARELLANEVIERIAVQDFAAWSRSKPDLAVPRVTESAPRPVETIDLERDDAALAALSRERLLALSLAEMRAIRDFFRAAQREATDVELEVLAQTWSEHCKHKIFNASITYREGDGPPEVVRSLFKTYVRGTTEAVDARIREREGRSWLVSLFHDNAGVIAATPDHHLVYKVETHNSPSALDPYGGAITGIVGVNRDPFGTGLGADLLCNVWGYCFAPPGHAEPLPAGLLHPRRIREGVHAGVIDGGNQSGIPYARGWEFFDPRFLGKPLVYCGTVGRMPVTAAGRPGHVKNAQSGDRIVMVGGRIGKDGIHGATFSSAELTEESPVQAVQIGDPITQKMMFDFLLEARDLGHYSAITDNGAGGLSSSVGEMAQGPGGARLELSRAPLKYQGLAPWEILVSEAQERMTCAVPPDRIEAFLELARRREVEATDLGAFTNDGDFHVTYDGRTVCRLPLSFLHDGCPVLQIEAEWRPPRGAGSTATVTPLAPPEDPAAGARLLASFLARDNMTSNEDIARVYDHEVKGLTVVKPWIGVHRDVPADATVLLTEHENRAGFALAEGVFPAYSDHDAHAMAQAGVDLAVRRLLATGARYDRIAALDNFCWPDPLPGPSNPDATHKAAQLVRACRGLSEICRAYGVPLVSGKDSMKNDAVIGGRRISIPPTLLVSAIGLIDDVAERVATLQPAPGRRHRLFVVGLTRDELGGTEWAAARKVAGGNVPRCVPEEFDTLYRRLTPLVPGNAVHAVGRGGLLPALFYMARAGGCGVEVDLGCAPAVGDPGWEALLFGESCGRFLVASPDEDFAKPLEGFPVAEVGSTSPDGPRAGRLVVRVGERTLVDASVDELAAAWQRRQP